MTHPRRDTPLRDGTISKDPRLTRIPWHDPKSLVYGIAAVLDPSATLVSKTWRCTEVLDQGNEGACTGFAVAHELIAQPVAVPGIDDKFAREKLYWEAQKLDPFPGGDYPGASPNAEGSTVLAAMKVAKNLGYIEEYRWALNVEDLALAIGQIGPAVLGIPWYEGMYTPHACGFLHPTGASVGGHAILCRGFNAKTRAFLVHNSWGRSWGEAGTALIHWNDMQTLLASTGDAAIPLKRRLG
jgi:hypothetical protein